MQLSVGKLILPNALTKIISKSAGIKPGRTRMAGMMTGRVSYQTNTESGIKYSLHISTEREREREEERQRQREKGRERERERE